MKFVALSLIASASAFAPSAQLSRTSALNQHIGSGGMADTRNPEASVNEDPRKSISAAPSFEEYLKQRAAQDGAPAAAAPVAAAPAAATGTGGDVLSTLQSLQGPGEVWGADGIAVGKEESDLRGYDNFGKFFDLIQSTGVAAELQGAGPFTIFAPTDPAIASYETMRGPVDARVVKMHIVPGLISSADVSSADLTSLGGEKLTYRYAVRKNFVNDAIIGEKTFGPYSDYPIDVACSNGVIHGVGLCFAM
eukprot:g8382.t2 g8382   contig29:390848-391976(+)